MGIRKILFATKFRELSFDALSALLELKDAGLKEVVLLHVIEREQVGFVPYGGYLKEEEERLREIARVRFEEWQQFLERKGIKSKFHILVGKPVPKILAVAEEDNVDLIVAGRKKRRALERYVGSNMLDLLHHSKKPVLVFKYMWCDTDGEREFCVLNQRLCDHLLLATDLSEPSERAFRFLENFKGPAKKITLVHVVSEDLDKAALEKEASEAKEKLKELSQKLQQKGFTSEYYVHVGKPVQEILKVSQEYGANMIFMGTTGKGRWRALWLGSVSQRVAEFSQVPVLLVP
ncbi:MAG: universal stress protein [Candidatus Desulfofervidaceae bacterium]|nr:universal stress protein [Candidatus Desulfofervidaceae bacterium]